MQKRLIKREGDTALSWVANPYIKAATSDNTRKAYRSDIQHFEAWGGHLPASPEQIIAYLQVYAPTLNPRTLARRLTALKQWHNYQGFPEPTKHPAVQKTMAGILRIHGRPKKKARPLTIEDLMLLVKTLSAEDSLAALRDKALLQVGYFGALRRSELVGIQLEHVAFKQEGLDILIPNSKTDQNHQGQYCALPYGRGLLCPVKALQDWLAAGQIKTGPLFREIKKGGALKSRPLSALAVTYLLKKRAAQAGLTTTVRLSSHSLRRGLATSANILGANLSAIMRQGRWKQVNTVMEYVEANTRFSDNAASKILEQVDP